jgi:hypothetical protein
VSESDIQPYYFTSYDRVIGIASNVRQLDLEMRRLSREDRACLEYHLSSGFIVRWLEYADEPELANNLKGISSADEAILVVERYVARAVMFHRMRRGRMH